MATPRKPKHLHLKRGAPKLYKPEYCEMLIEWMKAGNSFPTFGTQCNPPVTDGTLYEWVKEFPDFSEAKKLGKVYEMLFLEKVHMRIMVTGEGNVTASVWAQKNRCRKYYKERAPKGAQQIQLTAKMDVRQLVQNMSAEEMAQLVTAIEQKTLELEKASDNK